jgi:hypothetical protein
MTCFLRASLLLAATLAYAVVRYHVFGPVPVEQFPLYVLNKAVSFAAVGALLLAAAATARGRGAIAGREWGRASGAFALLHVVMSLAMSGPAYYAGLHLDDGRYTAMGGAMMTAGAVATWAYLLMFVPNRSRPTRLAPAWGWVVLAGVAAGAHCTFLGWNGWFTPERWHGGMPPITMLSAAIAYGAAVLCAARRTSFPTDATAARAGRCGSDDAPAS